MGKFYISDELIKTNYNLVKRVLSYVVTVECTHHYYSGQFEYITISPLFDVVEDGCRLNEYRVIINDDEIQFEKIKCG
ncbi:hypothetical protein [Lysinibacillus sp. NPDC086135]|uniref:hypothetical protein n=1 Tax=Lysinibacillus sp. NPDC086135 TaxID=3364130 RepID=UPI00380A915D